VAVNRKLLGERHPDVINGRNNLAMLYYDQGRRTEADQLLKETLSLYGDERDAARARSDDASASDTTVGRQQNMLGGLIAEAVRTRDYSKAWWLQESLIAIWTACRGRDDWMTVDARLTKVRHEALARVPRQLQDSVEGVNWFESESGFMRTGYAEAFSVAVR